MLSAIDDLPGFRRRFRVAPHARSVAAEVEDDFHHMRVMLEHDGTTVTAVDAEMPRAPWTTCPGARQVLGTTFTGTALVEAARRGLKQTNCTHLYDLAVLAAAHAGDAGPTCYDVLVADPIDGETAAVLRRNGAELFRWTIRAMVLTAPAEVAGHNLLDLRGWIEALEPERREAARILQWACLIAHGRQLPLEHQSDATRMPPNCYTFQPETAARAVRVGRIIDFSRGGRQPLEPGE
jgi:hypothetical protein